MALLKGSASYARFRAQKVSFSGSDETGEEQPILSNSEYVVNSLKAFAFHPIDPKGDEERAAGFVELERHDETEFSTSSVFQGDWLVFSWRIDTIRISASQMREELAAWVQAFEAEHQRPPSRFEKSEAKDSLRRQLRDITPPATKTYDVTWNSVTDQIQIFCLSRKVVDEIQTALEKALSVRLLPRAPMVLFNEEGLEDAIVKPTPELCWPGSGMMSPV